MNKHSVQGWEPAARDRREQDLCKPSFLLKEGYFGTAPWQPSTKNILWKWQTSAQEKCSWKLWEPESNSSNTGLLVHQCPRAWITVFFLICMLDDPNTLPGTKMSPLWKHWAHSHMWFCHLGQRTPDEAGIDAKTMLKKKQKTEAKQLSLATKI